jgi:predicted transcriptional regulator
MPERATIVLDDDLVEKLRRLQSNLIRKSNKSVSFSKVVNDTLRKGIK